MARSRRAAVPSLLPSAGDAVLQGVRNTTSRTSRPSKQKHDVSGKDTTADKQSASKSRFAVAKQVSRPPRATRKPLSSISTNRRTTTTRNNDKASSKQASQHAQQLPSPEHFISSVETVPTQPIEQGSRRVPVSARAPSVIATGTPSAVEQSMLVLKSFKRRPRQPSMLNMVKQRLASARSSIAADAISMSSEDDSLNLDDFHPDAAGTPLISSGIYPMAPATSPVRKRRRSGDVDNPDESIPRKLRKLVSQSDAGDDAGLASSPSQNMQLRISVTPELEPHKDTDGSITGLNITELAAGTSPVYQSSEPGSPAIVAVASQSSIYGPPISQHTPPPQRHTRATRSKAPSSAVLQSLLPRRRKRFAAAFPIPAIRLSTADIEQGSDEEEPVDDAEEHSEFVSTTRHRAKKAKQHKKTSTSKKAPGNKIAAAKTYGRRKAQALEADHEDTDLDLQDSANSTSLTLEDVSKSQELEAARKAFADIDKWEMEYETLTNEDSRDSSQGWR